MKYGNLDPTTKTYASLTLQNSWTGAIRYAKVAGLVIIHSNVSHASAVAGSVIATLPAGFRPPNALSFPATANATGVGVINIFTNGEIQYSSGSLSAIVIAATFLAA